MRSGQNLCLLLLGTFLMVLPATALAGSQTGRVKVEYAEIKSAPQESSTTVEVLQKGAVVTLNDVTKNGYYRCRTKGSSGWILATQVRASRGSRGVASESAPNGKFYFDGIFGYGYSGLGLPNGVSPAPTMTQVTLGGSIGYSLAGFFFGLSTDYRLIQQQSAYISSVGNWQGARWNIVSPMIGAKFKGWLVKLDFEFIGNYNLSNADSNGATVSYSNPLGGRVMVLAPVLPEFHLKAGLMGEFLQFSSQNISSSAGGGTPISLSLWQIGGVVGAVF